MKLEMSKGIEPGKNADIYYIYYIIYNISIISNQNWYNKEDRFDKMGMPKNAGETNRVLSPFSDCLIGEVFVDNTWNQKERAMHRENWHEFVANIKQRANFPWAQLLPCAYKLDIFETTIE